MSYSGTLAANNAAPVAFSTSGELVWYSRNAAGLWDVYIGNKEFIGTTLLPSFEGNRGPSDITNSGRYVLLTAATETATQKQNASAPGQGSGNSIQLYDRNTSTLHTLLAAKVAENNPSFSSNVPLESKL